MCRRANKDNATCLARRLDIPVTTPTMMENTKDNKKSK